MEYLQIDLKYTSARTSPVITNINHIDRLVDLVQGTMVEVFERSCSLSAASETFGGRLSSKNLGKIQNCGIEPAELMK